MVTAIRPYTYADLFDWPPDGDDWISDLLGGDLERRSTKPPLPTDRSRGRASRSSQAYLTDASPPALRSSIGLR